VAPQNRQEVSIKLKSKNYSSIRH